MEAGVLVCTSAIVLVRYAVGPLALTYWVLCACFPVRRLAELVLVGSIFIVQNLKS